MMSKRLKTTDISMATKTIRDSRFFFTSRLVKSVNISFNRTLKFTILRYVSFPSNCTLRRQLTSCDSTTGFPTKEMTSDTRAQNFHIDDVPLP